MKLKAACPAAVLLFLTQIPAVAQVSTYTVRFVGDGTPTAINDLGQVAHDVSAPWSAEPAKNPGAGAIVQAQLGCRDPQNPSNQTTSLSNAMEFTIAPE